MKKSKEELEAEAYQPQSNDLDKEILTPRNKAAQKKSKYVSEEKLKEIQEVVDKEKREQEIQDTYNKKIDSFKYKFLNKLEDCAKEVANELALVRATVETYRGQDTFVFKVGEVSLKVTFKKFQYDSNHYFDINSNVLSGMLSIEINEDKELFMKNSRHQVIDPDSFVEELFKNLFE